MTPREKQLAAVVLSLLAIVLLWSGWGKVDSAYTDRENRINNLRREVRKKEQAVKQGQLAHARRLEYQRRSLPANRELAQFQYRSWLRKLIDTTGWSDVNLRPQQVPSRRGVYERLAFTISGRGSLPSLVRFLYAFYLTDHLHQIRRVDLQPTDSGKAGDLELVLQVEALSLPDALAKQQLKTPGAPPRALLPLDSYVKSIGGRNLFAPYSPPPPPSKPKPKIEVAQEKPKPPPPKPSFDDAKFAFVTGILQDASGEPQLWVQVRTTGETLKLHVGDPFRLGSIAGTVVRIDARQAVLALGEEHLLVSLGESVREGVPVPAEGL